MVNNGQRQVNLTRVGGESAAGVYEVFEAQRNRRATSGNASIILVIRDLCQRRSNEVMKALFSPTDAGPIGDVEVGMKVIDAAGAELGVVTDVNMSDPSAVTTEGNEFLEPEGELLRVLTALSSDTATEPRVREPVRTRLVRIGYMKVEGRGPARKVHYVRADRIARVIAGCVELSVGSHEVDTEV